MNLLELKEFAGRAIENANEFGDDPKEIIVSVQIDDMKSESIWSDDIELTYDGDGQASGCVLHGFKASDQQPDKEETTVPCTLCGKEKTGFVCAECAAKEPEEGMRSFNRLTPAQAERIALLLEELGEVQQAIGKILRHGYESSHPDVPERCNRDDLEKEIGHVELAVSMMKKSGDITDNGISSAAIEKYDKIHKYLHHQGKNSSRIYP